MVGSESESPIRLCPSSRLVVDGGMAFEKYCPCGGFSVLVGECSQPQGPQCLCGHPEWMHGARDASGNYQRIEDEKEAGGKYSIKKRKRSDEADVKKEDNDENPSLVDYESLDPSKRLEWEYKNWLNAPLKGFHARPMPGNYAHFEAKWQSIWLCGIPGSLGTDWARGTYKLKMHFPSEYPDVPPK